MNRFLKWEQLTLTQQLKLRMRHAGQEVYHNSQGQMTSLLPKEDVALFIWGNKITGDISSPLRFHASKEVARKYLATRKKDKWSY
jgi:hypothetical protein